MTDRKFHFVYLTTNLINNRYYIGKHSTYDINDNYLGSGKTLFSALKKYGKENFKNEILFEFHHESDAYNGETEIISYCINDPLCYNIAKDGKGPMTGMKHGSVSKKKMSVARKKRRSGMLGKSHSYDTKLKMSMSHSGNKNFQYGKIGKYSVRFGKTLSDEQKIMMRNSSTLKRKIHMIEIMSGDIINIFESINEAGRYFNKKNGSNISACLLGKTKSAYGYKFKYV